MNEANLLLAILKEFNMMFNHLQSVNPSYIHPVTPNEYGQAWDSAAASCEKGNVDEALRFLEYLKATQGVHVFLHGKHKKNRLHEAAECVLNIFEARKQPATW